MSADSVVSVSLQPHHRLLTEHKSLPTPRVFEHQGLTSHQCAGLDDLTAEAAALAAPANVPPAPSACSAKPPAAQLALATAAAGACSASLLLEALTSVAAREGHASGSIWKAAAARVRRGALLDGSAAEGVGDDGEGVWRPEGGGVLDRVDALLHVRSLLLHDCDGALSHC